MIPFAAPWVTPSVIVFGQLVEALAALRVQVETVGGLGEAQVGVDAGHDDAGVDRDDLDAHERDLGEDVDDQALVEDQVEDFGQPALGGATNAARRRAHGHGRESRNPDPGATIDRTVPRRRPHAHPRHASGASGSAGSSSCSPMASASRRCQRSDAVLGPAAVYHHGFVGHTGLAQGVRDVLGRSDTEGCRALGRQVPGRGDPPLRPLVDLPGSVLIGIIVSHWHCPLCDVGGRDHAPEPSCWNCGGIVVVTSRPSLEGEDSISS